MTSNRDLTLDLEALSRAIRDGELPYTAEGKPESLDAFVEILDALDDASIETLMKETGGGVAAACERAKELPELIQQVQARAHSCFADEWEQFSFAQEITCGARKAELIKCLAEAKARISIASEQAPMGSDVGSRVWRGGLTAVVVVNGTTVLLGRPPSENYSQLVAFKSKRDREISIED